MKITLKKLFNPNPNFNILLTLITFYLEGFKLGIVNFI